MIAKFNHNNMPPWNTVIPAEFKYVNNIPKIFVQHTASSAVEECLCRESSFINIARRLWICTVCYFNFRLRQTERLQSLMCAVFDLL